MFHDQFQVKIWLRFYCVLFSGYFVEDQSFKLTLNKMSFRGWICTKGYIVGYVPKCLPAKREEIRTIVPKLIEILRTFGKGEPNLEKILSFLITQEVILSLLILNVRCAQQGKGRLIRHMTEIPSCSCRVLECSLLLLITLPFQGG